MKEVFDEIEERIRQIVKTIEDQEVEDKFASIESKFQQKYDAFVPVSILLISKPYYFYLLIYSYLIFFQDQKMAEMDRKIVALEKTVTSLESKIEALEKIVTILESKEDQTEELIEDNETNGVIGIGVGAIGCALSIIAFLFKQRSSARVIPVMSE